MGDQRIRVLIQRFFSHSATDIEMDELATWVEKAKQDEHLQQLLEEAWSDYEPGKEVSETAGPSLQKIRKELLLVTEKQIFFNDNAAFRNEGAANRYLRSIPAFKHWIKYAAAIFAILGSIFYFTQSDKETRTVGLQQESIISAIKPGEDKAILTLSDGTRIVLDTAENGPLARQSTTTIYKENGLLVYNLENVPTRETVTYNTMSTPKGGQYRLKLHDGTNVWLNAESSVTFPSSFSGHERLVKMTGEVYFDVSPDKHKPFIVEIDEHTKIEVLGTQFNINAYTDEPVIQATLLEGSIQMGKVLLSPGQAWVDGEVRKVDTESVVAWKKGLFTFNNADLTTVMRCLQRWYDIDVRFEGPIPKHTFHGELKRNLNLYEIMEVLSYMEINYRLENKKTLIISKR